MTRKDRVNAELAFDKQKYFLLYATVLAIIAWLFNDLASLTLPKAGISICAFFVAGVILTRSHRNIYARLSELEKLP